MIIIGIILYFLVGFISLLLMHMYKNELGINMYDPPHPAYYDDYDSNAQAYIFFSIFWPFFWLIKLVFFIGRSLVKFSEIVGKKFGR
jgi:hypothetical protein